MIALQQLSKRYGETVAVDVLELTVAAGKVTGFLVGPDGSGKSTTMRMILGWPGRRPAARSSTAGAPTSSPSRCAPLAPWSTPRPRTPVVPLAPTCSAWPATTALSRAAVDELLGLVGLADVAHRRVGTYSLGMGHRLGIAAALLGDPGVLVFDEPVNRLDTDGVRWVRQLCARSPRRDGRYSSRAT